MAGSPCLRALPCERLPRQPFLYLGDHAHAPHGARNRRRKSPRATHRASTRSSFPRLPAGDPRLQHRLAVALRELQQNWLAGALSRTGGSSACWPRWWKPSRATLACQRRRRGSRLGAENGRHLATPATVASQSHLKETANARRMSNFVQRAPSGAGVGPIEVGPRTRQSRRSFKPMWRR